MAMDGVIALALAKSYANKVGSTITGTSYNYDTGKLTISTIDGDWDVTVNNGMNTIYKNTLDNVVYDATNEALKVNGIEVLTKDSVENEDIDFGNMFN